jgi:hypothetical protein
MPNKSMDVRAKQLLSYHVMCFPFACTWLVSPHVISIVGHLSFELMKFIIQHFVFALFLLFAIASFCGCFAQSQNSTNVAQPETTKSSPMPSPPSTNTKPADDLPEMIKLQIKGIYIENSYYKDVLRQFGKPLSSEKAWD